MLAEVIVAGMLAAEDRARLRHHLFHERMPHTRANRRAAELPNDLGHHVRADEVVEDRRPGMSREHPASDERRHE